MNIYSSEPFLKAFNETYFPHDNLVLQNFNIRNLVWRLPVLPNGKVITRWQFLDFFEPLDIPAENITEKKIYIERACLNKVSINEWFDENLHIAYAPAPFIQWKNFSDWDAFVSHVALKNSQHFPGTEKLKRKLAKNLGPVTFLRHDPRPEVLRACIAWKSAQFPSFQKYFENPQNFAFFENLVANGIVLVSSLTAGEHLLAVNICGVWENHFYNWISSYNTEHAKYGGGRVLLDFLLKDSYSQGDIEFDFLLGNESYKWTYATHTRLLGEVPGIMPLTKTNIKEHFIQYPKVYEKFKNIQAKLSFLRN